MERFIIDDNCKLDSEKRFKVGFIKAVEKSLEKESNTIYLLTETKENLYGIIEDSLGGQIVKALKKYDNASINSLQIRLITKRKIFFWYARQCCFSCI